MSAKAITRRHLIGGLAVTSATAYAAHALQRDNLPSPSRVAQADDACLRDASVFYNVRDFGAVGDGRADDHPAIMAALARIATDSPEPRPYGDKLFVPGGTLYFPPGRYRISRTLSLKQQVRLLGETRGNGGGRATTLLFPPNTTGILINRHNTEDQEGVSPTGGSAEGSVIDGIAVTTAGPYDPASAATGIYARARCSILNSEAYGFARDGFAFVANETMPYIGNCNQCVLRDSSAQLNGRHGLLIAGGNANACIIENFNCVLNGGYGFRDETQIGQTWIGGHSASNGQLLSGPYRTTSIVWWKNRIYALLPGVGHADHAARTAPDADPQLWSAREEGVPAPFPDIPQWRPGIALAEGGAGYIWRGRHVHVNPYTEGRQGPYFNNAAIALGGSPGAGFVGQGINIYPSEGYLNVTGASDADPRVVLGQAWQALQSTLHL